MNNLNSREHKLITSPDQIPNGFTTREEEARWWMTHDFADGVLEEGPEVDQEFFDLLTGTRGTASSNQPASGIGATESKTFSVMEERLRVGKRMVERGGVRVRWFVTETPVEEDVTLRDETIHVDRRPVDRAARDADFDAFEERTIEMTETDEEAVVSKEARVVEEVVIGKDVEERRETVRDTARRTNVEVEEIGADRSRDSDFRNYDSDFRQHYETTDYKSDYSYEQSEPAYRYGYTLANDERYRGLDWNDIEPAARREWESRNEGSWEDFRAFVRHSWERAVEHKH